MSVTDSRTIADRLYETFENKTALASPKSRYIIGKEPQVHDRRRIKNKKRKISVIHSEITRVGSYRLIIIRYTFHVMIIILWL